MKEGQKNKLKRFMSVGLSAAILFASTMPTFAAEGAGSHGFVSDSGTQTGGLYFSEGSGSSGGGLFDGDKGNGLLGGDDFGSGIVNSADRGGNGLMDGGGSDG